jgi:uncharacterized protein (DUF952 family)
MSQLRNPPPEAVVLDKTGHFTLHLTPVEVWEAQAGQRYYIPEPFEREGFIHCTDSPDELIAVGNRYCRDDARSYLALRIDCERVSAPIVYEDPGRRFPHIYGPLERDAVRELAPVRREPSGEFVEVVFRI